MAQDLGHGPVLFADMDVSNPAEHLLGFNSNSWILISSEL